MAKGILRALGEELRSRRLSKNLSQEKLAGMAEVHPNYIGMIERGERNPTLLILEALSSALKIPVSDLILGTEKRL